MPPQSPPGSGISILQIEAGLTFAAVVLAFVWPTLGSRWFSRIERVFGNLARRKRLSVCVVGLAVIVLRLAMLPLMPIPLPFSPDDFSFLLAADTFSHGRLANPTPTMWVHFESIHIDMIPTYMSMYFPGPGLVLAVGQLLFGVPWLGLVIANALMCAGFCWMLQGWLPPKWALLGGSIAILRVSLFSYWINTYSGGGALAALGGALVLGGLPRFIKSGGGTRQAFSMVVGVILLGYTRPSEGLLVCLSALFVLIHWLLKSKSRKTFKDVAWNAALPSLLLVAAIGWMFYYDYRAFGDPKVIPYSVNRKTYAVVPYYAWQRISTEPLYRHRELREFYMTHEIAAYRGFKAGGVVVGTVGKVLLVGFLFYCGLILTPSLLFAHHALLDRRIRVLAIIAGLGIAGASIETSIIAHYLAPYAAAYYAIGLQSLRHLRRWKPFNAEVGLAIIRLTMIASLLLAGARLFAPLLGIRVPSMKETRWELDWSGPGRFGTERRTIQRALQQMPGGQIAIVRYELNHDPGYDWVYNAADIDHSKVIWAREMDPANDRELLEYYKDRKAWLVEPDVNPVKVTPYPSQQR